MKATIRAICCKPQWGVAVIGLIGLCAFIAGTADAMLTPQGANGTIEVMVAGETSWKPIAEIASLRSGDQVRTMTGSSIELWFDDGSLFRLGESTQILLKDIQVSQAEKSRIAKISLVVGTITAKITKLGYTQSLCEIDTGTVLVGVKFSQATVQKFQGGTPDLVIAEQGTVDIQQIGQGEVRVAARIDGEEGMDFVLNVPGSTVSLNVQNLLRRITFISENAISGISSLIGSYDNFLKIENLGDSAVLCNVDAQQVSMYANSQASIGISPERALNIETAKAAFTYQQRELQGDVLMVFNHVGKVTVNGEDVAPGSFKSVSFGLAEEGKSRTLQQPEQPRVIQTDQENRVEPPSKRSQPSKGGGIEMVPTIEPSPTEMPTVEPSVTPGTETPTPEEPTATPQPTLPPQPTKTPPSPSKP
ncbi:hypothetical protein U14_00143 [Candidatus Moduliflexus flocculans]|uniref:FecR protein domain-containing protein n=1 Tax=Candidatus Moduliflexus flocculans TaxID=1499966 RepID=A0A0S6VUV0_9BACT|nr:hypothetical protein U14_00143 [Candidatus Moduliflexus flocculans]